MKKGFTLIELMVAMAIIAVLVMLGYGTYIRSQRRALDARRSGDMKAFQNAMEQTYAIDGDYPDDDTAAGSQFPGGSLPVDPMNDAPYQYAYTYSDPVAGTDGYCGCARLAVFGGNSGEACDYTAVTKQFFCVSNLQ